MYIFIRCGRCCVVICFCCCSTSVRLWNLPWFYFLDDRLRLVLTETRDRRWYNQEIHVFHFHYNFRVTSPCLVLKIMFPLPADSHSLCSNCLCNTMMVADEISYRRCRTKNISNSLIQFCRLLIRIITSAMQTCLL